MGASSASIKIARGGAWRRVAVRLAEAPWLAIVAGFAMGAVGVALIALGNPANTGLCASCFMENVAGALGLHANPRMAYLRPEILGIVLGAFAAARARGEFGARGAGGGGAKFAGGLLMVLGSSMFLGCPLKMIYRLGAGDLTALAGVAGLAAGVWAGGRFLREGFELPEARARAGDGAYVVPAAALGLLVAYLVRPAFVVFGTKGAAAFHAPWPWALGAGLLLGALGQRSRFCVTGSMRDALLTRRAGVLAGIGAMLAAVVVANVATGSFHAGIQGQPSSHLAFGWSFAGMALVGLVAILVGGCPYRQLVLAGQGNLGAGAAVLGMLVGGAAVQAWDLGATLEGPTTAGKVAVLAALGGTLLLANRRIEEAKA